METCKYDNCDSQLFNAVRSGPHVKMVCAKCGKYQQFVPQDIGITVGGVSSPMQQDYALNLLRDWKKTGEPMTVQQAGTIIKVFKVKRHGA